MIHLKKWLHPFLGATISYQTLIFLILFIVLGNGLSFLVDRNFYYDHPIKAIVFTLLLSDVIGGAYMNTQKEVISYYDNHSDLILKFAPFHAYILILIFIFPVNPMLVLGVYVSTVLFTTRTLTLVVRKRLFAYIALFIGAFVFGMVEDGYSLSFVLFNVIFVYKLLISFGTRHFASCPVNIKVRSSDS